ncbi:MAG TPA: PTS sugar transporter subunit IIC [Gemmatimonadales bacterium]|nr:PTS sugar transporter subunit IIC [Gemmatimonadales bacterium]
MTRFEPGTASALVAWGTLVGVDLVSFPQALLSRPLVAGTGAGLLLGDPVAGMRIGLTLELFALDVLPVGASRYPDYGPAVIAAVVLASGRPWEVTLGVTTLFALCLAFIGGWSLLVLRRVTGRLIQQNLAGLAAGDTATIAHIQYRGLAADVLRSFLLTAGGLLLAVLLRPALPGTERFTLVTAVAVGCAVAAAAAGAIRSAGGGARLRWLAVGAGLGLLMAALR